ncbi:hypothetical protein Goari_018456 [Gossypium aridum]|uniref:RNase H type-1 domain-containing protein n=1 Tax=Gossypium aridum TaxID=34290 RepID=A0A7J8WPT8_GOSAI|nr:hypothetical protein [Gossypium aridum]
MAWNVDFIEGILTPIDVNLLLPTKAHLVERGINVAVPCARCGAIKDLNYHAANTPWLRPPLGFLKCNVDEAWFEDVVTTNYAALLRDSHGHVVKCFIGIAQSVMDPCIAKAFVVREALSWLRSYRHDLFPNRIFFFVS